MIELDALLQLWSLSDPNGTWVLCGAVLLGLASGAVGTFALLRRQGLLGDALAHAALPGVCVAFLITQGSRHPLVVLGGAALSSIAGYFSIAAITRYTKIKEDSALAIVLSLFFGVGVLLLTVIQQGGYVGQSGLDRVFFGQAAALVAHDVVYLGVIAISLLAAVIVALPRLQALCFDPLFSRAAQVAGTGTEVLLGTLLVTAVVAGLQLAGVVLIAALLLIPPAAARYWSSSVFTIVLLSGAAGALAGFCGASVSYMAPRMPTGPWMVVALSMIFTVSMLCAPRRGYLVRLFRQRKISAQMAEENILATLYRMAEGGKVGSAGDGSVTFAAADLLVYRRMSLAKLEHVLGRLLHKGLVTKQGTTYRLTAAGLDQGKAVTRRHRLWELYLRERLRLSDDHLHADAEEIEHLITPDLEARLNEALDRPQLDPHGREIPRDDGNAQ